MHTKTIFSFMKLVWLSFLITLTSIVICQKVVWSKRLNNKVKDPCTQTIKYKSRALQSRVDRLITKPSSSSYSSHLSSHSLQTLPTSSKPHHHAPSRAATNHRTMSITITDHELPDETHNLYTVTFFTTTISTIVTNTNSFVDKWISDTETLTTRRPLLIGLDIEWRPNQSRNIEHPVAVLQLCVENRCLIFQILHSPTVPDSLQNFFRNPNYTFVGVGIENDIEKLTEDYNLVAAKTEDVRALAARVYGLPELKSAGIKKLAMTVLGKEVNKPKGVTMSRWDYEWLTPAQVQYACVDAFLSFEIARILMTGDQN